ncbi:MAG: (2Fe-2S)-binding protein, partial [Treponemataceae bacterium]
QFMLNAQEYEIDVSPQERLVSVLRNHFELCETKNNCDEGICGSCSILLNNKIVPACLIPISTMHGAQIITIEYFKTTNDYTPIQNALTFCEIELCASCMPLIVFITHEFITKNKKISEQQIKKNLASYHSHCVDWQTMRDLIYSAYTYKQRQDHE